MATDVTGVENVMGEVALDLYRTGAGSFHQA